MAVHKRTYRGYTGRLTPRASRFLVIQRYALKYVFRSRIMASAYAACFFFPLLCVCLLYLNQNASVLALIGQQPGFVKVDGGFFLRFLQTQCTLGALLTAFIGPTLISPDLVNGALPLYLSRPLSRTEYLLGKASVLIALVGCITFVPACLLFVIQSSLAGWAWAWNNLFIATGIFFSSAMTIAVFALLALAMSAWVRWKIAAGALVLAAFAAGAGFGAVINKTMRTTAGFYIDLPYLLGRITETLFHRQSPEGVSPLSAWLALLIFCALMLALLNRKLRVCEVA